MRKLAMTEVDALDLAVQYGSNAITAFTVYTSFTFAYLVTAYYTGSKLSTFQVLTGSGIYIVSSGGAALVSIGFIQGMYAILERVPTALDDIVLFSIGIWAPLMTTIFAGGLIISLYFMWQIRHSKTD